MDVPNQQAQIYTTPLPTHKPTSGIQHKTNIISTDTINNSGSYFAAGMAMGMSMTSDPQHHPMGSMNGLSYSHGGGGRKQRRERTTFTRGQLDVL